MIAGPALDDASHRELRKRAIFECCKWDVQVEDTSTVSRFPLVLEAEEWAGIARAAEALDAELAAAEREILARSELMKELALPSEIRRLLSPSIFGREPLTAQGPRFVRFDFHPTREGWRVSEANSDVPGGFVEASGVAALMREHHREHDLCGDPAGSLLDASLNARRVALVHATAFTDDRQVMLFLADRFRRAGIEASTPAPDQIEWRDGIAHDAGGALDLVVRFFPAEWLPNLPGRAWKNYFRGSRTKLANPAWILAGQSKRLPLIWDRLSTQVPAWREFLPETRRPSDVKWKNDPSWVLKPALGRVGEGVALLGSVSAKDLKAIEKDATRHPKEWLAQRRFESLPVETPDGPRHLCVGVFTIDGRAAGAYGRLCVQPLIDYRAQDVPILVRKKMRATA